MVATLVGYDVIVARRPIRPIVAFVRPYVPFAVMTAGYLWLRLLLFGQVAREGALNARGLEDFRILLDRHIRHVVTGNDGRVCARRVARAPGCRGGVAGHARRSAVAPFRPSVEGPALSRVEGYGRRLLYFGPVWWSIGVLPIAVAGYYSPRHVYLAAVGWAVVLGIASEAAWQARPSRAWHRVVAGAAALVLLFYVVPLYRSVHEWRTTAAVSHQVVRDVRTAALSAPEGSLLIIGAPGRSWEWALPFAVRPPFQRTDLQRSCLHRLSARAQLLYRAVVRRNAPDDSRLVGRRRPRLRPRASLGSRDRGAVARDRDRGATIAGADPFAARDEAAR